MTVIITHKGGTIEAHKAIDFWFLKKIKDWKCWSKAEKKLDFLR